METLELTSDSFWRSPGIHVALSPGWSAVPSGLVAAAAAHLPEGGCLFLTSGTTGSPKWVALEKRAFLHSARAVNARYDLTAQDHWLVALPEHHVGGFAIHARAWLCGACVSRHRPERWDARELLQVLTNHAITATSLVPTQLHDLVTLRLVAPPTLRLVLVGGGRLGTQLQNEALALGWPVCATYGMTETASQVASQSLDALQAVGAAAPLEVLPHWDVESHLEDECLIVRGPALARGYLSPASPSEFSWQAIPDSGLLTRDRVRLHRDGLHTSLTFLGRRDNTIKVCGELVSLEAVEAKWSEFVPPDCPTWCIIAVPDPRREHRLLLVVESTPDAARQDHLQTQLTAYHSACPRHETLAGIHFLPHLPRTDLGKIARHAIAARLLTA